MNNALTVIVSRVEIQPNVWATNYLADDDTDTEITVFDNGSRMYSQGMFATTVPFTETHHEILTLCGLTS